MANVSMASIFNSSDVMNSSPTFAGLTLTGITGNSVLYVNGGSTVAGLTLTNGQLVVGSTGGAPVATTLTMGNANLGITNGAGSITLTPSLTPSYTSATFTAFTANAFVYSDGTKVLTSTAAATDGQLLIGRTGNVPLAAALTQGTNMVITNGAGAGFSRRTPPMVKRIVAFISPWVACVYVAPPLI